jgi:flagellar assembly protein FliH
MSNLWRAERADAAASLGSFVVRRGADPFRAWVNEAEGGGAGAPSAEEEAQTREDLAFAKGIAEGRALAEAEFAAERAALLTLAETLPTLKPEPTLPLALMLAETVDRLVRGIVGEVEVDGLTLLARAKAAAALIGQATQPACLRAHPDDAVLLAQAALDVAVEPDLALPRGTLMIETAEGWIEDGPAVRLDRLRAELDKMAAAR